MFPRKVSVWKHRHNNHAREDSCLRMFYWQTCRVPTGQGSSDFELQRVYCRVHWQCCLTFTETIRTIRDGQPRTATSTLTQLLFTVELHTVFNGKPHWQRVSGDARHVTNTVFNHLDNVSGDREVQFHKRNEEFIPCSKTVLRRYSLSWLTTHNLLLSRAGHWRFWMHVRPVRYKYGAAHSDAPLIVEFNILHLQGVDRLSVLSDLKVWTITLFLPVSCFNLSSPSWVLPTEVPILATFVTAIADMPTSHCVIVIFKSAFHETVDDVVKILVIDRFAKSVFVVVV